MSGGGGRPSRLIELDALRGVAALSVVSYHYTTYFQAHYGQQFWSGPPAVSVPWGHYGVNLFFVISGFVITASTSASPRPVEFAVNRAARIYPAYIGAVICSSLLTIAFPGGHVSLVQAVFNLTMVQRWIGIRNVDQVYWTLALEMVFYAFVFVLLAAKCWSRPRRDWMLAAWALASMAWSMTPYAISEAWGDRPFALILRYGPLFIAGIAIREGAGTDRRTRLPFVITIGLAAAAFTTASVRSAPMRLTDRWSELAFSAAAVALVAVAVRFRPPILRFRPLVAIGEASYVLYLIHWVPGAVVLIHVGKAIPSTLAGILMGVVVIGAAIVIHRTLEVPVNRWVRQQLRRLTTPRSAPAPVEP